MRLRDLTRPVQYLLVIALGMAAYWAVTLLARYPAAHALPEYATRTGESCATCHVNPGGGGPRTLRGLLWAARGRPDQVPELVGLKAAPGVTAGSELYEIACAGCHGRQGEGLFAIELTSTGISSGAIRSFVLRGIPGTGMPAFEEQFEADQIEALVNYVAGLANGTIAPPAKEYPLPPAEYKCEPVSPADNCEAD